MGNYLPDKKLFDVHTHASGPTGRLPLQSEFLTSAPSGHIFGWTQDAAMGWNPSGLGKGMRLSGWLLRHMRKQ